MKRNLIIVIAAILAIALIFMSKEADRLQREGMPVHGSIFEDIQELEQALSPHTGQSRRRRIPRSARLIIRTPCNGLSKKTGRGLRSTPILLRIGKMQNSIAESWTIASIPQAIYCDRPRNIWRGIARMFCTSWAGARPGIS